MADPVPAEELRRSCDPGILCWAQLPVWRDRILEILNDVVPRAANRQGFLLRDLRDPFAADILAERLADVFHSVRAFHGCSPVNIASYYTDGLRPLSVTIANKWIREFYLDGRFPELSEIDVERAIADVGPDLRAGRIWFSLDDRDLADLCGHYLIYGSEYVMSVAASLRRAGGHDYQYCLRGRGIPTVFACDVPLSMCSDGTIREFAETVLGGIADHPRRKHPPARIIDHGFSLRAPLAPEFIHGHYHPERIVDWRRQGRVFHYLAGDRQ